ncbi:DUF262 domain-containing protein [Aliarcobacter butzleri]|uniref:DUF262 domain-containing protein n=1 Tax=Aliarcobacter butzleri TaxID=28197 RepID=UPI001EDC84DB|nr:DUF262 domain-containing protein [Aliarcobacter butzleri]MCG3692092.1 DUF262 domain-containing protein [Aliarcobacter butzleri]
MGLSLSAEQKDLLSIFNIQQQYIIPSYQRAYSWEYDECYQLYSDIMEAFKEKQDYFIGNLVIAKSNEDKTKLEVIDGQQRLSTLLILLKVLHEFTPNLDILKDCFTKKDIYTKEEVIRIKSEVFEVPDEKDFYVVLKNTMKDFEKKLIEFKDKKGNFLTKNFQNRFERNALFFFTWIKYYKENNDDLEKFIKFLLENTYLLPIELSGNTFEDASNKALKIFETLNNRGKSLDDADIFKGKLYEKAKKNQDTTFFIEQWKDLRNRCELSSIKIDDLFRFYSHVIRGRESKTTAEINIRDFFTKMDYSPFETKNYNEVLDELFKVMTVIEYIGKEKNKNTELAKWLQLIEIYTNQYPKMALIVYLFVNGFDNQNGVMNFLKKLVRFTYYIGSTSTIKFKIFNIIKDVSNNKTIDDFIENDISIEHFDYLGLLKNGYVLLAFYLTQKVALESFTIDKLINYKDEKYLVNWTKEQIENVANKLGNFVILDLDKKNLTIDKKADYYQNSKIEELNELSTKLKDFEYKDFEERDTYLKEILVKFFKGKI